MQRASSRHRVNQRRGSFLLVAMLLCAIIGISLVSYYKLASTALKGASRSILSFSAMDVAEMGIEPAMACFYSISTGTAAATAWSGWTLNSSTNEATRTFPDPPASFVGFDANAKGQVKVYVRNYTGSGGTPVIVAKSILTPAEGPPITKIVEVTLAARSLWGSGMVAKISVRMNSESKADSWISDPDNDSSTAAVAYSSGVRRDKGSVGVTSATNGALTLASNAEIYGTANTGGGTVSTSSNVQIHSATTPAKTKVDSNQIHRDFTCTFPPITVPTCPPSYLNSVSSNWTGGSSGSPQTFPGPSDKINPSDGKYYYQFASNTGINMDSNKYISITDKVVLLMTSDNGVNAIHTSSNANITVTAGKTLEVYTNGNIALDSNNNINVGNDAKNFSLYGTNPTSQSFVLSSNVSIYGTIYAPFASFSIDSNCNLYGAIITNTIQMDSNAGFHYDESLANTGTGAGFRVINWKELQSAADRATYDAKLSF